LSATAAPAGAAHQATYTDLTTNFTKAGESGSAIGDFAIRKMQVTYESAAYVADGTPRNFGMTQWEVADVNSKMFTILKIAGKEQLRGALHFYLASALSGISTSEATVTVSSLSQGLPGVGRPLKLPIPVGRTDTVEQVFGIAGGATLAFSDTTTGQNSLIWSRLYSSVKGDAR